MAPHPVFVNAVAGALRHRCRVAAGSRVLVGVSGGADSVALLRALAAIAPARPWRLELAVAHVQHHLRSERRAEGDARFVRRLAERLGLPCLRADVHPGATRERELHGAAGDDAGTNIEARARRERYRALVRLARDFGATHVAVAHHADDQLETLLMRLLRGAGLAGLSCMAWRRGLSDLDAGRGPDAEDRTPPAPGPLTLVRPMLAVDRAGVESYLRGLGQDWRTDHTNADRSRWRARLRAEVLPVLRALRPDAARRVMGMTGQFADAARLLDRAADRCLQRHARRRAGRWSLDRSALRRASPLVAHHLLRRLLIGLGAGPDRLGRRTMDPILAAVRDGAGGRRTFCLSGGVTLIVTADRVRLGPAG